jgi:hypothetical protein
MSQTVKMVDSLDLGLQGNTSASFPKTLKRGWARPGQKTPLGFRSPGHRTLLLARGGTQAFV